MTKRADRSAFEAAKAEMAGSVDRRGDLCSPFLGLLPVTGASVALLGERVGQSTIAASDDIAARLDELQFDLGEGPCWEALATRHPVLAPNIVTHQTSLWPTFSDTLRADVIGGRVGGMFAFPLAVGNLDLGAIDLYTAQPLELSPAQVADASVLATLASWQVLRLVLADTEFDPAAAPGIRPRREVHQATGMVLAQLGVSADDAALLIRAHAFASGRSVFDVSVDVIERRLDFSEEG